MVLSIITEIRNFFYNLFSKFSLDNLVVLIFGIVFGFLLCFLIYIVFVFTSLKKEETRISLDSNTVDIAKIERLIRSAKNQYVEESAYKTTGQKLNDMRLISWELINDIAREYYPNSNYPIYELSVDEIIILVHYITNRIDSLFKGPVLKQFKKVRISYILRILDLKKKFDENKAVKTASKMKKPWKAVFSVLNIFNPVYWVKKLMISTTIVAATNKLGATIIEVVGEETNNIYSKSVFNEEIRATTDIEKTIMEFEKMNMEE